MDSTYLQLYNPLKNIGVIDDEKPDKITCLIGNGGCIFVGTSTGMLMKFQYEQLEDEQTAVYFFDKLHEIQVNQQGAPVQEISISRTVGMVVVLSQDVLFYFRESDLSNVTIHHRCKPISTFMMRDVRGKDETWIPRLCVAYKSPSPAVQCLVISGDHIMSASIECPLPALALCINCSGFIACVATSTAYYLVDLQNGQHTELFTFDGFEVLHRVVLVGKNEFLVLGLGGLGISTNAETGASTRPPIQWTSELKDVCFSPPYLFAVDPEFITVHSAVDQEQKLTLPAPQEERIVSLVCSEVSIPNQRERGQLILATERHLYVVGPQPWDQICVHRLKEGRLREVVQTLQDEEMHLQSGPSDLSDLLDKRVKRVHCLLGYALFSRGRFREAQSHFEKGTLDIRELLNLYPNLLPMGYKFQSVWERKWSPDPLLKVSDIVEKRLSEEPHHKSTESSDEEDSGNGTISSNNPRNRLYDRYAQFLTRFLEEHRESQLTQKHSLLVETALIKLYADSGKDLLLLMATMSDVDADDVVRYLELQGHYHTCALMHRWHGNHKEALRLWKSLCQGELRDSTFPGVEFVTEILCNLEHVELVLEHVSWLLTLSEDLGVSVFTQRSPDDRIYRSTTPDNILALLSSFPNAHLDYLEYLVMKCADLTPKHHQFLLLAFMEKLFPAGSHVPPDRRLPLRQRFVSFLESSNLYRVNHVLETLNQPHLAPHFIHERALLHGKINELSEALNILLNELKDWKVAEEFCIKYADEISSASQESKRHSVSYSPSSLLEIRSTVFETLLQIYTRDPKDLPSYSDAILHLLNNPMIDVNPIRAIQLLPEGVLLEEIEQFLLRNLQVLEHQLNTREMEVALLREQDHFTNQYRLEASLLSNALRLVPEGSQKQIFCSRCTNPINLDDPSEKVVALLSNESQRQGSGRPRRPQRIKHLFCPFECQERETVDKTSSGFDT